MIGDRRDGKSSRNLRDVSQGSTSKGPVRDGSSLVDYCISGEGCVSLYSNEETHDEKVRRNETHKVCDWEKNVAPV